MSTEWTVEPPASEGWFWVRRNGETSIVEVGRRYWRPGALVVVTDDNGAIDLSQFKGALWQSVEPAKEEVVDLVSEANVTSRRERWTVAHTRQFELAEARGERLGLIRAALDAYPGDHPLKWELLAILDDA